MTDVLVLGASGMVGGMVARVLAENPRLNVTPAARRLAGEEGVSFDAERDSIAAILSRRRYDWIVNAAGVVKPLIDEEDPASGARAMAVNATFPRRLADAALEGGSRVVQIGTDGVFSGAEGPYAEDAPHDARDVYAHSKSGGEVSAAHVLNLRCSIVGPERPPARSLLGWALSQPEGARITGYTNHRWNGVTSLHFAKLCEAVIASDLDLPPTLHVVPADIVSKAELLELALSAFGRDDVVLSAEPAAAAADRTLTTLHPDVNRRLWRVVGYPTPPLVATMMSELAARRG
jgi:dTDP-4-dehydrorhamnose reductase